jgi:hypothetical protein
MKYIYEAICTYIYVCFVCVRVCVRVRAHARCMRACVLYWEAKNT